MRALRHSPFPCLILIVTLTLPAIGRDPAVEPSATPRRPAQRLMERIRQDNPDEYRRLDALRRTDPDAFADALRCRIREHALERILDRHPRLREYWKTLPATERAELAASLRALGERPGERHPGRRRKGTARNGDDVSGDPGDAPGMDTAAPRTRPEFEAAYDQRTAGFEREIERISRQLEQLRRLLRERRRNRDRIIEWQLRESRENPPPDPTP